MGLIDKLMAKYDVYRLEQRYTRREKRTTFTSGARYVDGEYVYGDGPAKVHSTASSAGSKSTSTSASAPRKWGQTARTPIVRVNEIFEGRESWRTKRV